MESVEAGPEGCLAYHGACIKSADITSIGGITPPYQPPLLFEDRNKAVGPLGATMPRRHPWPRDERPCCFIRCAKRRPGGKVKRRSDGKGARNNAGRRRTVTFTAPVLFDQSPRLWAYRPS